MNCEIQHIYVIALVTGLCCSGGAYAQETNPWQNAQPVRDRFYLAQVSDPLPTKEDEDEDLDEALEEEEPEEELEDEEFEDEFEDEFADDEDLFADEGVAIEVSDPLQGLNRAIFWFNDKLYFWLIKPVARVYRVVPERARISVANFFNNVATPIRLVNAALQGDPNGAMTEFSRFFINTTVGVAGLFDPAKKYADLDRVDTDLGITLGKWGIGSGPYLVLPFFGPSSFRDGIGRVGDRFLDPWYWYLWNREKYLEYVAVKTFEQVNFFSLDKDTYEGIKQDTLDPYLFIRDAFMQNRQAKIEGKVD